jgi:hypothetical protein
LRCWSWVGHAPYPQLAQAFVATQNRIFDFLDRHHPPFIAKVYRPPAAETTINPDAPDSVALWYPR